MNTPVSFPTAKLLKEKGFRQEVRNYFFIATMSKGLKEDTCNLQDINSDFPESPRWSRPNIAEVVMWIHKEKGLWVNVMYMGFELKYSWSIDIITTSGSDWDSYGEEDDICYKSPNKAYEAAIIYALKNLI